MAEVNYEKLAENVEVEGANESPPPGGINSERKYLPLDHEKYQGIASAKGYPQNDRRLARTHYSHEAMIDVILANPTISQGELAQRFDRSYNWICVVMGSDAFQAALAKRRDDITDPEIAATITEKLRGLANHSLAVIAERLEATKSADLAVKSLEIATKALGFGARPQGGSVVNNNYVVAMPPQHNDPAEWAKSANPRQIENK